MAECKKAGLDIPPSNPAEVISYQGFLDRMGAVVEDLIHKRGHKLKHGVFVGEWPLGEFQASVTSTSQQRAIVLVNMGLLGLIHQMAKIITYSLDFVFADDEQRSLATALGWEPMDWKLDDAVEWIAETLAAYFVLGDCRAGRRVPLSDVARPMFAISLTTWAEIFVIAHEYAHLLLEHGHGPETAVTTPFASIEAIGQNQQDEFDADLAAADLCLATADWSGRHPEGAIDVNFRVAGPCLLFLVEVFLDGVRLGPHDFTINRTGSHPAPYCRMTRILDHFTRRYGGSTNMFGELIRQLLFQLIAPAVDRTKALMSEYGSQSGTPN